jgi:hypothetical protein
VLHGIEEVVTENVGDWHVHQRWLMHETAVDSLTPIMNMT